MPDHIHLFTGIKPVVYIPDFVKESKVESNEFINQKKWRSGDFSWQDGYGMFSYGHSQIDSVYRCILNQETHHRKKTFKQEYYQFLERFVIPFEDKFLFEWLDES